MKKTIAFTILLLICTACSLALLSACTGAVEIPEEKTLASVLEAGGYELVFADEFDGNSVDYTKWKTGYAGGVRRAAYYEDSADTLFVKDGTLTIRTLYKDGQYGEGWYTSWLETSTRDDGAGIRRSENYTGFSATYGYFEARCIAPPTIGIWSAFWLMPDEGTGMSEADVLGTGADGVEIDVMESPWMYSLLDKGSNVHVVHGDGYSATKSESSPRYKIPDMYTEFHTYGVLWTETEYIFYIDGAETWRTSHTVDGVTLGVSEVNEYMILSVEVGGYEAEDGTLVEGKNADGSDFWCGNPAKNDKSKSYDFVIDYVRVYRKP